MIIEKIRKNIIQPANFIIQAKTNLLENIKINLGSISDSVVQEWFTMLNKKRFLLSNYSRSKIAVAVLDITDFKSFAEYYEIIKGKNSASYFTRKSERMNNTFIAIDRNLYVDDIYEINTSSPRRQGKRMEDRFWIRETHYDDEAKSEYYGIVNNSQKLIAYIYLKYLCEAVFICRSLGHANYLDDGIMYQLIVRSIEKIFDRRSQTQKQIKYIVYDSFLTNSKGLSLFKKRFKFEPKTVVWEVE